MVHRTLARGIALLTLAVVAGGCLYRPDPTTVPIRTMPLVKASGGSRCMVVFLPGRGDQPEDFLRHGFPAALQRKGSRCAMIGVDSHLGYFYDRSIVRRLREDVIAPARAEGIREIWLAGISLGGFGSLLYAREYPEDVSGMVILAPFLGEENVLREIESAGGLAAWSPQEEPGEKDFRRLWLFLKEYTNPLATNPPPLYLGYGTGDRFAKPNGLLAAALPPEHVFTTEGGHTWKAWRRLWDQFLETGPVPGRPAEPSR